MAAPTHARYRVVTLATSLAMLTYLDRSCIATLASAGIMRDLRLSNIEMGWVFTVFQLSYAMFEIPTAWWADRRGTKSVLTRIVTWWSLLTAATAAAASYPAMLVVRFLFGAGEAGAWPCVTRTFSRWMPTRERGRAQGIFFAGAHLVGGLTPALILHFMLPYMSWRAVFVCFGALGLVWVAIWQMWFRNDPADHPAVNAAELQDIVTGRAIDSVHPSGLSYWSGLLRNRTMIALSLMYAPNAMMSFFCITWLPTYLKQRHGFDTTGLEIFAGLPLVVSMPGDLVGGWVTDRLSARYGLRLGRCGLAGVSYVIAGIALLVAGATSSAVLAAVLIAVATGLAMFTLGAAWGTVMDVGRNHVAVVGAMMNSTGALAGMVTPLIVGYSVDTFGSWNFPLYAMGVFFLLGALCWILIDPTRPVFEEQAEVSLSPALSPQI